MTDTESELSQLALSGVLISFGTVVGSLSKLVERAILTRFLSPDLYGDIDVLISVMTLTSTVALLGLVQGIPRYISRLDSAPDRRGIWVGGGVVAVTAGCITCALIWVWAPTLAAALTESVDSVSLLRLLAMSIPMLVAVRVGIGAIRGHENTRYRVYTQDLLYPLSRILFITIMFVGGIRIIAVGYGYLGALALALVATYGLLSRLEPLVGEVRFRMRELVKFSLPLAVSTVLAQLLTRIDTVMLGYFRPSREVGLYGAAYPLASAMVIVLGVFGYLYLPLASRLESTGNSESVEPIYRITTRWVYVLTFPLLLTFLVFPADVINIVFGPAYTSGALALSILAVGFFTNAAFGRSRETLSAVGTTRFVLFSNIFGVVVNVVLNLLLIPTYGFIGAAIASATSYLTLNLAAYVFLRRHHGVTPFSESMIRAAVVLPLLLVPTAYVLEGTISLSWVTLVPFIAAVSITTVMMTYIAGGTRPEDAALVSLLEDATGTDLEWISSRLE